MCFASALGVSMMMMMMPCSERLRRMGAKAKKRTAPE